MIKELNDLAHFIKTSVWRDEALLAFLCDDETEILQLYRTIWSKNLLTDEAAARAIGLSLGIYKKQARKLRQHLREMIVFFNDEKAKADATVKNQVEGAVEAALINLLRARGYRHAPLEIAKRLYRRGIDYDTPVFVAEALRILKEAALGVDGGENRFEDYSRRYWEYRGYADTEERAADCFQWVRLPALRKKDVRNALPELIRQRLETLEPFRGKIPSAMFHLYYYTIRTNYLMELCDHEGALSCYDEAIDYFSAKHYPVAHPLALFYYSKVPACILLERFDEGEAAVLAGLDCAPEGSSDFFKSYEMYFYLAMYAGHYDRAVDIYHTVTFHKRFGNLRAPRRETWHILGAYLFLVFRLGNLYLPEKSLPAFKSNRFANETMAFTRDKEGMNVAILIAHALMQLVEGKTDLMLERIQALDKYRERYLRDSDTDRSEMFIKILTLLPKTNFDPARFQKKAAPLLENLSTLPRRLTNPAHELEIVPYETLAQGITLWLKSN